MEECGRVGGKGRTLRGTKEIAEGRVRGYVQGCDLEVKKEMSLKNFSAGFPL